MDLHDNINQMSQGELCMYLDSLDSALDKINAHTRRQGENK